MANVSRPVALFSPTAYAVSGLKNQKRPLPSAPLPSLKPSKKLPKVKPAVGKKPPAKKSKRKPKKSSKVSGSKKRRSVLPWM